jgi:uncharacterized protein
MALLVTITDELADIPLVDQHCHPVVLDPLDRSQFELLLTEARDPGLESTSEFDSQVGLAVRRWCAPALGLDRHAGPDAYLARRTQLGPRDTAQLLLQACRCSDLLVDSGLAWPGLCDLPELGDLAAARTDEVIRVEAVAEQLAASGVGAGAFGSALADALAECASLAVAFKTVAAYRTGLDLRATAPSRREVGRAADRWLARCDHEGRHRLDDPTLVAHAVSSCLPFGVPLQVHAGYGDPDLTLHETDPSLLTPLLRALPADAAPVVLLHCYPYHRQAAYLANVFPQVVMDVSLAVNHLGPRAAAVLAETLELAPFGSLLYASDGFALPELHHLGAVLFRNGLARVLDDWLAQDALSTADASRVARMVAGDNARRIYRLAER